MPLSSVPLPTHSLFSPADPDIKAHIAVDGEPLEVVYKTDSSSSGTRKLQGYIRADPGRNFSLCLYHGRQSTQVKGLKWLCLHREGIRLRMNLTRRLCFARVDATANDDEVNVSTYTELDDATALEFKFYWVKEARIVPGDAAVDDLLLKQRKEQLRAPEDLDKLKLPMQPSFGPIEKQTSAAASKQVWETTLEDPHNPFATMKFLLRSEPVFDRLKLQGETVTLSRTFTPPLVIDGTVYLDLSPNEALAEARAGEKRVKAEEPDNSPLGRQRARQHEKTPDGDSKLGRYSPDALQTPTRPAPNGILERAVADAIAKVLPGVLADMCVTP
ncbi:hypothetical protein BMF94_1829 [Rhodotorula taiwanensis]|uniref:Uncharacterized protein n=1 Tax=Rhodotorula taiwanensis TaxID=741276 RepID=A0A2S5BEK2_9BASI|nr:hypothetical protein BMF94_1829 [Rhodotorula taiwanensis]